MVGEPQIIVAGQIDDVGLAVYRDPRPGRRIHHDQRLIEVLILQGLYLIAEPVLQIIIHIAFSLSAFTPVSGVTHY